MENLNKHRTPEQEIITSHQHSQSPGQPRPLNLGLAKYFRAANERLNYLEYGDPAEYILRTKGVAVPNSPLHEIWIPPRFKRQDEASDEVVLDTLLGDSSSLILVLADPGCGKSTLSRFLTCFFIDKYCNNGMDYFGLFVPLTALRMSGLTNQEAVARCAAKYVGLESDPEVIDDIKKHLASACVIFDGLDELPIVRRVVDNSDSLPLRRDAALLIRALRYVQTEGSAGELPIKCIVTSRSKDYFEDKESSLGALPHYFLSRFSPNQMNAAVRVWHDAAKASVRRYLKGDASVLRLLDERKQGIISTLREHADLATVCLTPLMLNVLQTIYTTANDLPSSVSQLCWRAINWFLVEKHLTTGQKDFVTDNSAWLLQTITEIGWQVHTRMVDGLPKAFTDLELRQIARAACPIQAVLGADYETQEDAITRVASFLRRGHGVLVSVSVNEFDFVHNVFREVLAGRALSRLPVPERRTLALNELWHGPIRYWAGLRAADHDGLYEISAFVGELSVDVQSGSILASLARAEMLVEVCATVPQENFTYDLKKQLVAVRDELFGLLSRSDLNINHRITIGDLLSVLGYPELERSALERVHWVEEGARDIGRITDHHTRIPKYQKCPAAPPIRGWLRRFGIGSFLVTNREFAEFIRNGGYGNEKYWPSEISWKWAKGDEGTVARLIDHARTVASIHFSSELAGQRLVPDEIPDRCVQMIRRGAPLYWIDPSYNRSTQPVVGVNWWEALAYCLWFEQALRSDNRMGSTMTVRLPIEAEWETVARLCGDGGKYPWVDGEPADCADVRAAFGKDNAVPVYRSCAVGLFQNVRTNRRMFDLVGNVWEWTASKAGVYSPHSFDQKVDFGGLEDRISRGSSWLSSEEESTEITFRSFDPPYNAYEDLGFRIAICAETE